jgi:hypothetical protein
MMWKKKPWLLGLIGAFCKTRQIGVRNLPILLLPYPHAAPIRMACTALQFILRQ